MAKKPAKSPDSQKKPGVFVSTVAVNDIRLQVHLGYGKEERKSPQFVSVDCKFYYPSLSAANLNDKGDFICYDKISHAIQRFCSKREFHLIEFLGTEIFTLVRKSIPDDIKLWVRLTKCNLPISFVLGGASFTHTDLPPFSWVAPE